MEIKVTKMHGLGNDFVLVDGLSSGISLSPEQIMRIADRRLGVGCDQVLLVERPRRSGVDANYRIFNADGGEAEQCGNGARCVARYLRNTGWVDRDTIIVETLAGIIHLYCRDDGQVQVGMGTPRLAPAEIPLLAERQADTYEIEVNGGQVSVAAVSMGNPHAVLRVPDTDRAPVDELGPAIGKHWRFPQGANVGFMQVIDAGHIRLRVFERGAGETPACGTGACAAVVAGRRLGLLDPEVNVVLPGGQLTLRWQGAGQEVWMTGPATKVFDARMTL